jgi:flagellar P-ring protein precursor FlgI
MAVLSSSASGLPVQWQAQAQPQAHAQAVVVRRHRRILAAGLWLCTALAIVGLAQSADAARIKDIAFVQGVRENQLLGYGLVVGLDGTGDHGAASFTVQSTASMLSRMGIRLDESSIQTRNVAAVMVTAELPPFARSGQRLDLTVASLGNARSLQGGTLVMTPLLGPDGEVYAVGQGNLTLGGYDVSGGGGNSQSTVHPNVGRIPEGAIVERQLDLDLSRSTSIRLILFDGDFTTAVNVARAITERFDPSLPPSDPSAPPVPFSGIAQATDSSTVVVEIPEAFREAVPQFISSIEELQVETSGVARIIVNERTGTVVLSGDVSLSEVAVAHGNLRVTVSSSTAVSQPNPLAAGRTEVVGNGTLDVQQGSAPLILVQEASSIADVVAALNALGTTSHDLIAILQAIDAAGALHGRLEIQ